MDTFQLPKLSRVQFAAVLAGLRLLAANVASGSMKREFCDIGEIWTDCGDHEGLDAEEIQKLGDQLNGVTQIEDINEWIPVDDKDAWKRQISH